MEPKDYEAKREVYIAKAHKNTQKERISCSPDASFQNNPYLILVSIIDWNHQVLRGSEYEAPAVCNDSFLNASEPEFSRLNPSEDNEVYHILAP